MSDPTSPTTEPMNPATDPTTPTDPTAPADPTVAVGPAATAPNPEPPHWSPPPPPPPAAPPLPPPPAPPKGRPPRRHRGPAKPPNPAVKALFIVAGAIFTVAVLAWGTLAVVNLVGHVTERTPVAFGSNIKVVVVRTGSGGVTVRGSQRSDIGGQRTIEYGLQKPTIEERVDGDTLTLDGHCNFSALAWCRVLYDLDVPHGVRVDVQSGAGSLNVSGIDGDVEARSGAGGMKLSGLSGDLNLSSGAGSIEADRLRSHVVTAESGAGSTELQFLEAPTDVSVSAGAGSVDVEVPKDGTAYEISGDSGAGSRHIDVATASTSDHVLRLHSGAGSTTVHYAE